MSRSLTGLRVALRSLIRRRRVEEELDEEFQYHWEHQIDEGLRAGVSPEVPVSFTTMEATVSKGLEDPRFRALLFGVFAGLAVCLAIAGIYGVMTHAVEQRAKEIGLRMALGATRGAVLRQILGQGLVLAAAGLALGLAAAVAATRLLTSVLFQVQPVDTQVYLGVVVVLGAVTLIAGYLPAWRAAVVDPMEVLKMD